MLACSCPLCVCSRRGAHIFKHSDSLYSETTETHHSGRDSDLTQGLSPQAVTDSRLSRQGRGAGRGSGHSLSHSGQSGRGVSKTWFTAYPQVGSTPALTLFLHAHVHSFLGDTRSRAEKNRAQGSVDSEARGRYMPCEYGSEAGHRPNPVPPLDHGNLHSKKSNQSSSGVLSRTY